MGRPPFDLDQRPNAASVTITGPEAARDSANVLFGHFRSGFGHQGNGCNLIPYCEGRLGGRKSRSRNEG